MNLLSLSYHDGYFVPVAAKNKTKQIKQSNAEQRNKQKVIIQKICAELWDHHCRKLEDDSKVPRAGLWEGCDKFGTLS